MNIGFVSGRLAGTDGVSLETHKWADVMEALGHTAFYCAGELEEDGPPGVPLIGGLLFSPVPPRYTIGWLAVAGPHRRRGIGRQLVEHALGLVEAPAEVVVTTFGEECPEGEPARRFYARMGFHAAERAPDGPEGGTRQIFRKNVIRET